MTFSFSAPRFTEADERYEQEHLTEQERLEAWRDVYGKTEPLHESFRLLETAEELVETELAKIPNKQAYLDAVAACPEVVRLESPAIRFLRCEQYNANVSVAFVLRVLSSVSSKSSRAHFYSSASITIML